MGAAKQRDRQRDREADSPVLRTCVKSKCAGQDVNNIYGTRVEHRAQSAVLTAQELLEHLLLAAQPPPLLLLQPPLLLEHLLT